MMTTLLLIMVFLMPMDFRPSEISPLSMMNQSVDDMYEGCMDEMKRRESKYFKCDMKKNDLFKDAWERAKSLAESKYNTRKNQALTKDQIRALYVYTEQDPNVYGPFNAAVQNSADQYIGNTFKYYALHFWLTSAIQIINDDDKQCYTTTYRGTRKAFTGEEGQKIRFGFFASTSKNSRKIKQFGDETCFRINTCLGAAIQNYSRYSNEEEVLIPPYETFTITKKETGSTTTEEGLRHCKTIFVLESIGGRSNLNCKAPAPKNCLFNWSNPFKKIKLGFKG